MKQLLLILSTAIVLFLVAKPASGIAVMSIDLGSEFVKIAIVKPAIPMEIVLNKESKRKTPLAVTFRLDTGERFIGESALAQAVWAPRSAFTHFRDLLGKRLEDPAVAEYRERFPHLELVADNRTQRAAFRLPDGQQFLPEELVAMLLRHARQLAEDYADVRLYDAVVSVPSYFTQAERLSLKTAVRLSGLNLLQLMNSITAAALNYGVFRKEIQKSAANDSGTMSHVLIYDAGATSTVAAVVGYHRAAIKQAVGPPKQAPQLVIEGVGFDRSLGGLEMQMRLKRHLEEAFLAKHKSVEQLSPRAHLKLMRQTQKVKEVLSANSQHMAQVEGLMDDIDMRELVSRDSMSIEKYPTN